MRLNCFHFVSEFLIYSNERYILRVVCMSSHFGDLSNGLKTFSNLNDV